MKRILCALALLSVFLAIPVFAQQANITSPVNVSESQIAVQSFSYGRDCACIVVNLEYQTGAASAVETKIINVPAVGGTLDGFLTAIGTARTGETGVATRRAKFRILGYLVDNNLLTGVTLQP